VVRRALAAPVIYSGSVERTSFAERDEEKGYWLLTLGLAGAGRGKLLELSFVPLPARPMVDLPVEVVDTGGERVDRKPTNDYGLFSRDSDIVPSFVKRPHAGGGAVRVLPGLPVEAGYGPTFSTELLPAADGRLAVASCGEERCRIRVLDPRSLIIEAISAPHSRIGRINPRAPIITPNTPIRISYHVCHLLTLWVARAEKSA
jgi:hypothetical protein